MDLSTVSSAFLVSMITSWVALFIGRFLKNRNKASTLILGGLLLSLVSSFFFIDYKGANSVIEKQADVSRVRRKLIAGLAIAAFGFTLSSIGVEE